MNDQFNQKKKTKPSVRHHYLPQYYLKGFTDSAEGFFVYDKNNGNVFKSSPVASFFEKNLNTVTFPDGDSSDFLEDFYTQVENHAWKSLDAIRTSTKTTSIGLLDKINLFFFLSFLHWRLPSNLHFVEQLSEKAFKENDVLDFFTLRHQNGEKVSDEVTDILRSSPMFKKFVKAMIPFAPFLKDKNWNDVIANWRFLYSADNKNWYIFGDNPIITEGYNDPDPINCLKEFVFPVSGRILLVNTEPPINQSFPPEIVIEYGAALIQRARRFVAFQDESFLKAVVRYYEG